MESGEFMEYRGTLSDGQGASLFGTISQSLVYYSILSVLFKSEAIFTFFVYWLKGLAMNSGTIGLPNYNTLSHLWLLKPFFSLLIDRLNFSGYNMDVDPENQQKVPRIVQYNYSHNFLFFSISNYRVAILLVSEYVLALSSLFLYILYLLDCFQTFCTNILVYALAISLVCASSYAEGLFSRYARTRGTESYSKLVSLRLLLSSFYGFTTILCLLIPVYFHQKPLGNFFQINLFFPLYLMFNAVLITWLVSRPVVSSGSLDTEGKSPTSPLKISSVSVQQHNNFSLECLLSLLLLTLVSIRLKNDFYNRYNHTSVDNYTYVIFTQLFKFVTSLVLFKFVGPTVLMRLSMGIFGLCLLLYPLKTYTAQLFEKMVMLGPMHVILIGFFLSYCQQVLLAYSLLIAILITPPGYDASILSLPTFVAHITHLCLRQHVMDYIELSNQKWFFQLLSLFVFSYCFSVLLKANEGDFTIKLTKSQNYTSNKENKGTLNWYSLYTKKRLFTSFESREPKSPWGQRSETSFDSDPL